MQKLFITGVLFTLALAPACSNAPTQLSRTPATFGTAVRTPGQGEYHDYAVTLIGPSFAKARPAIEKEVKALLKEAAATQRLLADHDLKLEKKDVKAVDAAECVLMETYSTTHTAEEKLLSLQQVIFDAHEKADYAWFVSQVWPTEKESPALSLTKATFVRHMASFHENLCGAKKPCSRAFPDKFDKQAFNPLDENALLAFKKTNLQKMANDKWVVLPKVVSCGKEPARGTAAVETSATGEEYDWKKFGFTGAGPEMKDGEFAITYDDGPHETYTPQIAQMWFDSGLGKPTFFWLARNVPRNLEISRQVRDAGFEIGCHSRSHSNLDLLSRAVSLEKLGKNNTSTYASELKTPPKDFVAWRLGHLTDETVNATEEIYKTLELDVPGKPLDRLFRLPGGVGVGQPEIGKRFAKLHARHYHWSIDSLDFNDPSPQSIVERVEKLMELRKKGIVLFHDIHPQSVEASRILIEKWKKNPNIKFVNVPRFKPGYEY